ncbi:MAG: ATP-binding cassette domain-containing protein [Candidatus Levybacteria bacterium]|nr:ATP-binding cassette domain-containing protein [Candidatus Levybacteria bacterium]
MIKLDKVSKTFILGSSGLVDITLVIDKGEFVFLVGPTGSGKTTIFRLLIRDMLPSKGTIIVGDFDIVKLPHHKVPHLRKKIGVVFQDLKLLMDRTIFENVVLPLEVSGVKPEEAKKRVEAVLTQVGILEHYNKFPIQLSGGERQRAAIARALVFSPDLLLADEPTGNLDPSTGRDIVNLLLGINEKGTTVVMATHNIDIVNNLQKRVVALDKGRVIRDQKKGKYATS